MTAGTQASTQVLEIHSGPRTCVREGLYLWSHLSARHEVSFNKHKPVLCASLLLAVTILNTFSFLLGVRALTQVDLALQNLL